MLAQPNFGRLGAVGYRSLAAAVRALFANNEQGAWYDPQDYGTSGTNGVGTLYQDSAGTTLCSAVEQPVGLMLDKRKGLVLGSELVTFASLTGTAEWSYASNVWTLTNSTTNSQTLSFTGLTSGSWYRMTVTVTAINAGSLSFRHPNSSTVITNSPTISAAGTYTISFVASGTTVWLRNSAVGQTITVSAFSVREIAGNHAYQSTSAARPTLRARYNLLTYSEQFDNAAWTAVALAVAANNTTAPDGTTTADKLTTSGAATAQRISQGPTATGALTFSVYAKAGTAQYLQIIHGSDANIYANYDLGTGAVGTKGSSATSSITAIGNGWYQCSIAATITVSAIWAIYIVPASNSGYGASYSASVADLYVWGADMRPTNLATGLIPLYQRIAAATDYDTVGFPVYIQGNGSSQFMLTSAIDFSGTDKMTVWTAVRKLSDAATSLVAELSTAAGAGNPGSFAITAPNTAAATTYGFRTGGSVSVGVNSGAGVYASPITNVLTMTGDISGDALGGRINGTTVVSSALDQGTGNFGNYALYLLARAGASIWFSGYFYGAIIRGAASDEGQIQAGEKYLNNRARVY